jgi:hypothetical protein
MLNTYYFLGDQISVKRHIANGVIWSAIPLVRPDASLIVLLNVVVLMYYYYRKKNNLAILTVISIFGASLLPSLAYYGYSYFQLGSFSVSASSRAFALQEGAASLLGMHYSTATLRLFLLTPAILFVFFATWGFEELKRNETVRLLAWFSALSITVYILLLTLVSPVNYGAERYLLPVAPLAALLVSVGVGVIWVHAVRRKRYLVPLFMVLVLIILPVASIVNSAAAESRRGLAFDVIVERNIVEYINRIAEQNSTILIYEVQDRFYLRPDLSLLSLDGITDGKVGFYLDDGDIHGFLLEHRPRYWLANEAVHYRPFLAESILRDVIDATEDQEITSVRIGDISFTSLGSREDPLLPGFSAYTRLYRIDYED